MKLIDLPKEVQEVVIRSLSSLREMMELVCTHDLETDFTVEDFSQDMLTIGAMLQELNDEHEIDKHKFNKLLNDLHIDL